MGDGERGFGSIAISHCGDACASWAGCSGSLTPSTRFSWLFCGDILISSPCALGDGVWLTVVGWPILSIRQAGV
jgi:hypothetical protein